MIKPLVPLVVDGRASLYDLAYFPVTRHLFAFDSDDEGFVASLDGDPEALFMAPQYDMDPLAKTYGVIYDPLAHKVHARNEKLRALGASYKLDAAKEAAAQLEARAEAKEISV